MSISSQQETRYVLQICHCYYDPFLDCARQYAVLFKDSPYKVITVFLSGKADPVIAEKAASDVVIFLEYSSKQLSGLKLGMIQQIRNLTKHYEFSAVIAHRIKPTYVALMATKLPILSIQHSFGNFDRLSRRLLVNLFKSRLTLLAVSNAVRDEARQRLVGWTNDKILTMYNRIDVDTVKSQILGKNASRDALKLPADAWIVGSVGRLHPDKDPETLIHAFSRALPHLPSNALLVMLGKGKMESQLRDLLKKLGIETRVRMLGMVPEAKRYFRAFDVFVLSSDHEPFGMVLLEAMAAETPIICTDCGGAAEIVKGVGELFPLGDINQLAKKLINSVQCGGKEKSKAAFEKLNNNFSDIIATKHFKKIFENY